MTASSRMVYAFARDSGLPASGLFAQVHPRLHTPVNALYLTTSIVVLFGCVFLVSSTGFFAISSASVVALSVSYALPIIIHCIQGRYKLPSSSFVLPPKIAWFINFTGIFYSILTSVLFLLPPELPVDSSNMNYGGVALALVVLASIISWIFHGRKHYNGPALLRYQTVSDRESLERSG